MADTMTISVKPPQGDPIQLKVKKDTPFRKVFEAVAKNLAIDRNTLRFIYDGSPVTDEQSPKMLEMEDGDQIDCMIQQVGGNADGDEKAEQKVINVVVKIANAAPLTLKVKDSTKMEKIFNAVAQQTGRQVSDFRFFYDGAKIKKEKTAKEVGLEDGDEIEAMIEQVGGAWC